MKWTAKRIAGVLGVAGVAMATAAGTAAPSYAGMGTGPTDNGYSVHVSVHVTGDVSQSLVGSVASPPPLCWWAPMDETLKDGTHVDPTNPKQVEAFWKQTAQIDQGSEDAGGMYALPDYNVYEHMKKVVKSGHPMTFYELHTRDDFIDPNKPPTSKDSLAKSKEIAKACGTTYRRASYFGNVIMSYRFFAPGTEPPPAVDPKDLAEYAYNVMDLVKPTLNWNPKISAQHTASLVNLPTWLWVRDHAAVEQRSVTATAGGVSATVTAGTDGVSITSPVISTQCSDAQAATSYSPSAKSGSACTMTFPSASWGYGSGYPVLATTTWHARWTSNIAPGGALDPKTQDATTNIPVVESRTLVDNVG